MNVIVINGRRIEVEGNNVTVSNGRVIVDGREVGQTSKEGPTTVKWEGELANLTTEGEVHCGDVHGNVRANVVECENVGGSVNANTVNCGNIAGSVNGNVVTRR